MDVLAIGAHPDDVELGVGALIHKLSVRGCKVGILDLTQGEMSTRGTPEERAEEARKAAQILKASVRENADLPDGALANTTEQQRRLITFLRSFRPMAIITHMDQDRHPDHTAAYYLVRDANFFSGLARIDTGQEPHRAARMYFYHPYIEDVSLPQLVVDVSDHFEAKLEALRAHASQFYHPDYPGAPTYISTPEFWETIRTRAAYWGHRVGVLYGEPLYYPGPIGVAYPPGLEERP